MFGYFKRNKAKVVISSLMPGLREGIQALSPIDRAGTLAIVNAMMDVAADQWGQGVLRAPTKLAPDTAAAAVLVLASHHARLVRDGLGGMPDRGMNDVAYAHAMRETRATEIIIATLGACLYDGPKGEAAAAWSLLWRARGSAPEAAEVLRQYGRHAKVDPVPRSRKRIQGATLADLQKLASSVPPFLQSRKPATPAAKPPLARTAPGKPDLAKAPVGKAPAGKVSMAKGPVAKAPLAKAPLAKAPPAKAASGKPPARPGARRPSGDDAR